MKQVLLFVFAMLHVLLISGTVHTVSNLPSTLAQYNTINAAISAASDGDTIYVHGSPVTYAAFTLSGRQLVIIGPGWAPDKNLPLTAIVAGGTISGTASSGSELHGLVFSTAVIVAPGNPISDVRVIRCTFNPAVNFVFQGGTVTSFSNFLFEGNWFNNMQLRSDNVNHVFSNFLVRNNLFNENGSTLNANILGFTNTSNFVFDHNVFYGSSSGLRDVFTVNCRFFIITNNIFIRRNAMNNNSSSTFSNNITYLCTGFNQPWAGNSNIDGGGNISDTDPQMASQASVNGGIINPTLDFTIAAGPANDAGTDGLDMGLLFNTVGSLNWNSSRSSRLPLITLMNITTPAVTPGGNIGVTIESRVNN